MEPDGLGRRPIAVIAIVVLRFGFFCDWFPKTATEQARRFGEPHVRMKDIRIDGTVVDALAELSEAGKVQAFRNEKNIVAELPAPESSITLSPS